MELETNISLKKDQKVRDFNLLIKRVMNGKYQRDKTERFLVQLKSYHNLLARLLEVYLYHLGGNSSKAEMILMRLMQKDIVQHSLKSDIKNVPSQNFNLVIKKILVHLKKESFSSYTLENFLYYLRALYSTALDNTFEDEFKLSKNMSYIRDKYMSPVFGYDYPYVWFPTILGQSPSRELKKFIDESDFFKQGIRFSDLAFYRFFSRFTKQERKNFLKRFSSHSEKGDLYHQLLYFDILERENLFKMISAHQKVKLGLLINHKRELFKKFIKQPPYFEFSLYYLVAMGDIELEHLQKLMNSREI